MARLRRTNNVTLFTFEEKTRLANFFMLLVEIDLHLPKTAKAKTKKRTKAKVKNSCKQGPCPILRQGFECQAIKCPAMCCALRPVQRDLFLLPFIRIFNSSKINFMGYEIDRHHCFVAYARNVSD